MLLNWFLCGYSRHLWPLCIFKITDKCSLQFSSAILSKKLLLVLVFYTLWWVCVSCMYVLLASLGKCALNQHISTKTRAFFKLNQTRCQNFAGLHSFLHGGSDKQPVFMAVGQTSDLFPFLSWQMIPSGTVCYPTL